MPINLQQLNDSSLILTLVSTVGRLFPIGIGHWLADIVARQIANRKDSQIIQAIRANQWVVRGEIKDEEALDQAVRETLKQSARAIFDLYHYLQNLEAIQRLIVLDATSQQLIQRPEFDARGLVIVGLHLSNFDLVLQWMCKQGLRPLVLTIPTPQGGRRKEYERRKKIGMNLMPASVGAIRQAILHLKKGGVVLTGIDRPISNPKACPLFFGRPAALPIHHIFLATKAQVPVMVMVTNFRADGKYHILTSEPIEMDQYPKKDIEELRNAEKVLKISEKFIRQAPQQWSISLPVWPDTLSLIK